MSRPIQEPTTQRAVRGLGFSSDQLFRRPAPTSAGGGQLPYAVMEYTCSVAIPDNTKTILNLAVTGCGWDNGYINQAGLDMTPQPFAFDFDAGKITFRSSGLYHAELMVNWCDTFTAGTHVATILDYFGNCPIGSNCGDWINFDFVNNNQDFQQNWFFASALWISIEDADNDSFVRGIVGQVGTAAGADICGASLIITRLSPYDADGDFLP